MGSKLKYMFFYVAGTILSYLPMVSVSYQMFNYIENNTWGSVDMEFLFNVHFDIS